MLSFHCQGILPAKHKPACLVLPVFSTGGTAPQTDAALQKLVNTLHKRGDISGKPGESLLLPHCDSGIRAERLLLLGAGDVGAMTRSQFLTLLNTLSDNLNKLPVTDVTLMLDTLAVEARDAAWIAQQAARQLVQGQYRFDQLKKEKKPAKLKTVYWFCTQKSQIKLIETALKTGLGIGRGMALARDLGNLPGNICTPSYLASRARELARKHTSVHVKVLEEKQMKALKMGALLSVSAGSDQVAKLVVIDYQPTGKTARKSSTKPVVLIGKGITFDSGGISIKPGAGMEEMKFDMCGAASVMGVMQALAEIQAPIHVIGILACAENMPSGRATKPGDIITSMSGKTIEVINTDAEGRLVLCDALTYAERYQPAAVIDIATLTGACVIALGNHASGLFSNRDELAAKLFTAGQESEDKAWHMPLWEEYQQQLKSPYADIANVGGRNAGSVTAACFLARFAEKFPWAHLDIAGTAWNTPGNKGATGRPVPLLMQYLLNHTDGL
jgi:leucyl aminopeptidase